jgi:hypothetical protein
MAHPSSRPARASRRQLSLEIPSSESDGETGISFVDPHDHDNENADANDDRDEEQLLDEDDDDADYEDYSELLARGGGGGAQFQGEFDHYHEDEQDASQDADFHQHAHSHSHSHGAPSTSSAPAPTPFHMVRVRHLTHERSMIVVRGIAVREVARLLRAALQTGAHTRVVALRDAQSAVVCRVVVLERVFLDVPLLLLCSVSFHILLCLEFFESFAYVFVRTRACDRAYIFVKIPRLHSE